MSAAGSVQDSSSIKGQPTSCALAYARNQQRSLGTATIDYSLSVEYDRRFAKFHANPLDKPFGAC